MKGTSRDHTAQLRWCVYLVLIAVATGNMTGRLLAVNSVDTIRLERHRIKLRLEDQRKRLVSRGLEEAEIEQRLADKALELEEALRLQRPFLSGNDRSRWLTVRALVEHGTYAIDAIIGEPTWDTIDMVQHRGRDGELHLYSSKPPLLATLVAGEYWLLNRLSGATLGTHPYALGRLMLLTINVLPLMLMYFLLARIVEQLGESDWGRILVMASATFGTLLTSFAVVLNNHVVAAVSTTIALYAAVQIWCRDDARRGFWCAVAGFCAAFAATCELPALALVVFLGLALGYRAPKATWCAFLPATLPVAIAFFATNYVAHESWRPPYAHRSATDQADNWYEFDYEVNGRVRKSYWSNPRGIDRGEPARLTYAAHVLVGHHGLLSLTPVWLLSLGGTWLWLRSDQSGRREIAGLAAALTAVCLLFFIGLRPQRDRNYGGMTNGFRWLFWLTPLWLMVMLPAADRLGNSRWGRSCGLMLLTLSVLSVAFATWNPWTHPWVYRWLDYLGWPVL